MPVRDSGEVTLRRRTVDTSECNIIGEDEEDVDGEKLMCMPFRSMSSHRVVVGRGVADEAGYIRMFDAGGQGEESGRCTVASEARRCQGFV